ncbi:hypothetical protein FRB90_005270 [Tulasnella sp. 427]|nr:hypothetical protein FRB90_005270 [Tulasnella sp. 427]
MSWQGSVAGSTLVERTQSHTEGTKKRPEETSQLEPTSKEPDILGIRVKRDNNMLSPVNRLPPELLLTVFWNLLSRAHRSYNYSFSHYTQLTLLASVCWRWCTIIRQARELWTVIGSNIRRELRDIAFQRAGACPLTINFQEKPHLRVHRHEQDEVKKFAILLEQIFCRVGQWKAVNMSLEVLDTAKSKALEYPAHSLQSFTLNTKLVQRSSQVDLFGGHAPNLVDLCIIGCPVKWSRGVFQGLLTVEIRHVPNDGPTVVEVLSALARSPRLKRFVLDDVWVDNSPLSSDTPAIHLPNLEYLLIRNVHSAPAQSILSQIQAPSLGTLLVHPAPFGNSYDISTFCNVGLRNLMPTVIHLMKQVEKLGFRVEPDLEKITVTVHGRAEDTQPHVVTISFYDEEVIRGLRLCSPHFVGPAPRRLPIALVIDNDRHMEEGWLPWIFDTDLNTRPM